MRIGGSVRDGAPPAGDDMPAFDESPPRAIEFPPRALRPAGRRGPIAVAGWALALAGLAGVGLLAGEPSPEAPTAVTVPTAAASGRLGGDLPSTYMGARLSRSAIDLESPTPARVVVTTERLEVTGSMLVRAARVQIALEARGNRVLDHVSVDVGDPDGGIRPVRSPTFAASFDLPFPRPNGTMWVVVTAYDATGMPLGSTRRPFEVGPLLEPGRSRADSNPMSELWRPRVPPPGLAIPPPTCLPVAPTLASSC